MVGADGEDLDIESNTIKNCNEFKYLGSIFNKYPNCERDIENRINQGKRAIQQLNGVWWSKGIRDSTKKRIYYTIIEGIVLYNSEVWEVNKKQNRKLQALEMDALRRSCRVSRIQHIPNTVIKERMKVEKDIIDRIEGKRLVWYGHLRRMQETRWPLKILNWTPAGKRRRGRPRRTWGQAVNEAMASRQLTEEDTQNRKAWRTGCGKRRTL